MKIPTIKTKNFILRPPILADALAISKQANNRTVSRFVSRLPYPYTLDIAQTWIKKIRTAEKKDQNDGLHFVIEKAGEVIGVIGLNKIQPKHKATLGYWLGKKYWGRGVATEVVQALCVFAFRELGLKKLSAEVFLPNIASRRVLEKNGFELVGLLKKEFAKNGRLYDAYLLAKLK